MVTVERTLARLDEFSDIADLTELHRQARGLVEYLREQDESAKTMKIAQLRIERRIGEVLAETVRVGNPQLSSDPTIGRLPDGISRYQSSKWQKLAEIATDLFEDYLGNAWKPSVTGALRLAACEASGPVGEDDTSPSKESHGLERLIQRGETFSTILADPPWPISGGRIGGEMTVAEIAALPVAKIAADVAQLHLWTTDQFLEDAISIMRAWGFDRVSSLIWAKPSSGARVYWSEAHEYLLLGVRGGAEFITTARVRSVVKVAPESKGQKPDVFRQMIEKVGAGPRLELFGRRQVSGWVVWGNEVESERFHQGVEDLLDAERDENSGE
jgi:N6-adenosine-specific RNA methylase IME4